MPVYTIVIFEDSPKELKNHKVHYIHKSKTVFDTGVKINLLQKFIFISLDNFKYILQNRIETGKENMSGDDILKNRLEEWLMFLSVDEPELIELLISHRPYFEKLYADIYNMCINTERLMNMYSKELAQLDYNTVVYMVDELKAEIDNQKAEIEKKNAEIERLKKLLDEK